MDDFPVEVNRVLHTFSAGKNKKTKGLGRAIALPTIQCHSLERPFSSSVILGTIPLWLPPLDLGQTRGRGPY